MSEEVSNGGAGWLLVAAGAIQLIWALIYLVLSIIGLVFGGLGAITGIMAAFDTGDVMTGCVFVYNAIFPLVNTVAYLVFVCLTIVVIVGGIRFNQFKGFGMARMASMLALGIPICALLLSLTSICNALTSCGASVCTGLICGNIPTLVMLLLGGGAGIYGMVVLKRPEVAAQFAMNDAQE